MRWLQQLLEDSFRDLRYGVRSLRRSPAFTVVASFTLALGVGAATAVFSVVNGVLIKPLPYPDSDALVAIRQTAQAPNNPGEIPLSATQFFTYRDENRTFAAFGLWSSGTASITGRGDPEQVPAVRVTHGTLEALAIPAALGRWFSHEDDAPGSPETVIMMNGYWQRRYGGDRSVVGRTLIVDSRPRTVIGVMPADFRFLNETPDLILPLQFDRRGLLLGSFNYLALGRLRPGVTVTEATADVARMVPIWLHAWPSPTGFDRQVFDRSPVLRPLKQDIVGDIGNVLWVLMGSVAMVLLIACANVANLLLVRGEARQQELSVMAALGAGWTRIARALLVESLLLGVVGGVLGLGLTFGAIRLLIMLAPLNLPRISEITVDPAVLFFALMVSLVSSVVFGFIPVIKHWSLQIAQDLRSGGRTATHNRQRHRARNTLVVVQVALALVLLVGSGLMIRTFVALRAVEPGFTDPDQIQLVRIAIPATLVDDPERVFRMQSDIRDRIAAIPGVSAASLTSAAPMEPFISVNTIFSEDRIGDEGTRRRFKFVSPGYFATVGTPVIAGRDFEWTDLHQRRPVAMISENMARDMWRNPVAAIGKRIRENPEGPWREIVGVVGDVFDDGVHVRAPMITYWPAVVANFEGERLRVRRSMTLAIRSSRSGTESFVKDIQQAVWSVSESLPLARVQTLRAIYEGSLGRTSFTLVLLAIAGAMSLVLGLVGIYGVIAYAVTQRRREIGVRIALGAQPGELQRAFVRNGIALAGLGLVCGLVAAVALSRLMSSLLFGISPLDPTTYVAVSVVLLTAATIASYVPARGATTADPVEALRE